MTRAMSYAYASYYDEAGHEIDTAFFRPDHTAQLARALLRGRLFCSLHRLPDDIRRHLPTISPNVMLPFVRKGIDPFAERFEVSLHSDGTIRGIGGVQVVGPDCATAVRGLFVAGDTASREKVAGAISGGGNVNSAWALASGCFAGRGAAAHARRLGLSRPRLFGLGGAGVRPAGSARAVEIGAARQAVKDEMHPFDKNLFRHGDRLAASLARLAPVWQDLRDHAGPSLAARETAALVATARWSLAGALARRESRGMHRREDAPSANPALAHRLLVDGLDTPRTRPDLAPIPLESVA
jgi:L-aspartate oxidase